MHKLENKHSVAIRHPSISKKLIHTIGLNLSTLNFDIDATTEMPSMYPGERGVADFVNALRRSSFINLANAFEVVHSGENRIKKGKKFPNKQLAATFRNCYRVIEDMEYVIGLNISLLDENIKVPEGCYRGAKTRVGEIVLSFYEQLFDSEIRNNKSLFNTLVKDRVSTLTEKPGFISSPLMQGVMERRTML